MPTINMIKPETENLNPARFTTEEYLITFHLQYGVVRTYLYAPDGSGTDSDKIIDNALLQLASTGVDVDYSLVDTVEIELTGWSL